MSELAIKWRKYRLLERSSSDTVWRPEQCAELRYIRSMRRPKLSRCHLAAICGYALITPLTDRSVLVARVRRHAGKHRRIGD